MECPIAKLEATIIKHLLDSKRFPLSDITNMLMDMKGAKTATTAIRMIINRGCYNQNMYGKEGYLYQQQDYGGNEYGNGGYCGAYPHPGPPTQQYEPTYGPLFIPSISSS